MKHAEQHHLPLDIALITLLAATNRSLARFDGMAQSIPPLLFLTKRAKAAGVHAEGLLDEMIRFYQTSELDILIPLTLCPLILYRPTRYRASEIMSVCGREQDCSYFFITLAVVIGTNSVR